MQMPIRRRNENREYLSMGTNQKSTGSMSRREILRRGVYGGLAAGLAPSLWLSGCGKQRRRGKYNVVVILIDTLRPDYLGFYGYRKETAKFLAKLARKSAVFTRAFSTSSWTAPAMASLFTSKYPHQHGVIEGFFANRVRVEKLRREGKAQIPLNSIPAEQPTLPEIFKSMGYATFGMATNINVGHEMGFRRGFDLFERRAGAPAPVIYQRMREWKGTIEKSKPFFLYLHPNDVHAPYYIRQEYYERQNDPQEELRARYQSEIGYVDGFMDRTYEMLNLADNTILVVVSDHGEEFWDHGGTDHNAKLYRELTQVLMIIHAPFLGFQPRCTDVNVSLIDVLPTLVELVDGEPLQGAKGVSLVPLLSNGTSAETLAGELHGRTLFAHRIVDPFSSREHHWTENNSELQHWAAIHKHWNLIQWYERREELFDHRHDLKEKHDVSSEHPEVISQLLAELREFKKQERVKSTKTVPVNLDDKLLRTLKSLGYVE